MWSNRTTAPNPFIYDRPLAPGALIDREQELGLMVTLADGGQSARLSGPRRYGKTTLLGRLAEVMREDHRFAVASVDLSRVTTLGDVALRLTAAYDRGFSGSLRSAWRSLRRRMTPSATVGVPGLASLTLIGRPQGEDALAAVHALLEVPATLHERTARRCLVIFDEFQELLVAQPDVDGVLRSHIQHHGHAVSYVFAGSHAGMMDALFGDRRRPLFEQARAVTVGPLPGADLVDFVENHLQRSGRDPDPVDVEHLVARAAGHPQRAMLLAHFLWEALAAGDDDAVGRAFDAALSEAADGLERTWQSLAANQRKLVSAVASGNDRPLRNVALAAEGIAKASMAEARDLLSAQGDVFILPGGRVMLADPFLGEWVRRARGAPGET